MVNRRSFVAVSATTVMGAIAGCSSLPGDSDDDGRRDDPIDDEDRGGSDDSGSTGGVESLDADGLLDVLHAPGAFSDEEHYSFQVSSPASIDDIKGDLDDELFSQLVSSAQETSHGNDLLDAAGVNFWDVGTLYSAGPVAALVGQFDRADVWRQLEYEGVEYQEDYEGYALLEPAENDQNQVTVAVEGEGQLDDQYAPSEISRIFVGLGDDSMRSSSVVQTMIDVSAGAEDGYREAVPAVESLVNGLMPGQLVTGETFEEVTPDAAPDADSEHEVLPFDEPVSRTLTSESTAELGGNAYPFVDRFGFVGREESTVAIRVMAENNDPVNVLLFAGNDDSEQVDGAQGRDEVELQAQLPRDGAYNYLVFDPEGLRTGSGPDRDYTVEISTVGGSVGGPEDGIFEGEVARGRALTVTEELFTETTVLVFSDVPDINDIDIWVSENNGTGERFGVYESVSQEQIGDRVVVTATLPVNDVTPDLL